MQNVGFTKGDLYWLFENANMQNMMTVVFSFYSFLLFILSILIELKTHFGYSYCLCDSKTKLSVCWLSILAQ